MVAARVALPSKTRGVDMLSLLSPESAALWSSPKNLMLSAWEQRRRGIRPVKPYVGIDPVEYPRYIARKLQADMVYLVCPSPGMVFNGVFGIVKDPTDDSIRDIIDARPFNCARGGVATPVHLPTPADLARLHFAPGERVVVGKLDLSNYYHHIRTPRWMHRLCALPPLTSQQLTSMGLDPAGPCVPVCSTLCMGVLDAVPIAQEISVRIARAACPSLRFLHELPRDAPVVMSLGPVLAIYLDDFAPIAAEQHSTQAQSAKAALQAGMEAAGFIVHATKDVAISPAPCDVIGCRISNSASEGVVMGPSPSRSLRLAARTLDFLHRTEASSKQLESLLGEWAWSLLAFRPLFSVFFSVYRFVRLAGASASAFSIWPSVRREFFVLLALLPLLRARLSRPAMRAPPLLHRCVKFRWGGGLAPCFSSTRHVLLCGHVEGVGVPRPYQRARISERARHAGAGSGGAHTSAARGQPGGVRDLAQGALFLVVPEQAGSEGGGAAAGAGRGGVRGLRAVGGEPRRWPLARRGRHRCSTALPG